MENYFNGGLYIKKEPSGSPVKERQLCNRDFCDIEVKEEPFENICKESESELGREQEQEIEEDKDEDVFLKNDDTKWVI